MRVLVLSSVFPNATQPAFGVFIRERMRQQLEGRIRIAEPDRLLNELCIGGTPAAHLHLGFPAPPGVKPD